MPALLLAQPPQSEHFRLAKSVMDAGGGISESANFRLLSAFGQPTPVGVQSSTNFVLYAGFLNPLLSVSPLSPIQELVILPLGNDARLWWEAIPGAASYSIYRDTAFEFQPLQSNFVATVNDTTYTDTGVLSSPPVQQYYIILVNSSTTFGGGAQTKHFAK